MARVLDSQAIFLLLLTWSFCTAQGIELSLWRTRDRQRTPSREEASHPAIRDLPPPWNSGDPRWYQAWRGGRVTVDLRNDGPTMTGANASFTARLHFPGGQCESSEGDVVWPSMAKNTGGAPVYPELGEQGLNDAYVPPGGRRRRRFVYVWSTRGQQWQQFGRASSKFSLSSDNFALGSYMMVLVVYHHRKSRQYIPIAKASTIYSITNQIPVTVEMRQAQDRLPGDNRFVTGASIDFAANIHDPRRFLAQADLTYTWDFGDESGTLIARVPSATHDYSVPGTYLPRLVVQATISRPCPLTQSPITTGPRTFPSSPSQGSRSIITTSSEILTTFDPTTQQPALDTTMIDDLSTPEVSVMTKVMSSVFPTTNSLSSLSPPNTPNPSSEGGDITVLPTITGMVSSISASPTDSSSSSSPGTVEPTNDDATTMSPSTTSDISLSTMGVATSVNTADSVTINLDSTSMTTGTAVVLTYNTASSENFTETSFSTATFDNETTTSATTMNTTDAPAALVLVKRQAPENSECPIYLYGTYRASIDLIEGITVVDLESSFTIVQAANEQSASLDFTVMCNGSIPTEVCTTVADNDCSSPHGQWCRPVPHQADCAIHLQELFNSTGSYCLNVTLVNSQSLALASTEVFVQRAPENISAGMIVGIVIIAGFLLVVLAFTIHRRKHSPQLSATYESFVWMMGQNELLLTLQSFFRHDTAEAEPLLRNCADLNQVLPKGC